MSMYLSNNSIQQPLLQPSIAYSYQPVPSHRLYPSLEVPPVQPAALVYPSLRNGPLHDIRFHNHPLLKEQPNVATSTSQYLPQPTYNPEDVTLVRHCVVETDDLVDLAVRYGTSVEAIRRHNRRVVFDYLDNVMGEFIYIPVAPNYVRPDRRGDLLDESADSDLIIPGCGGLSRSQLAEESIRNRKFFAARSFLSKINSGIKDVKQHCSEAEANFYLEEHNFDIASAIAAYRADIEWEKSDEETRRRKLVEADRLKRTPKSYSSVMQALAQAKQARMEATANSNVESREAEIESRRLRRNEVQRLLLHAQVANNRPINPRIMDITHSSMIR